MAERWFKLRAWEHSHGTDLFKTSHNSTLERSTKREKADKLNWLVR